MGHQLIALQLCSLATMRQHTRAAHAKLAAELRMIGLGLSSEVRLAIRLQLPGSCMSDNYLLPWPYRLHPQHTNTYAATHTSALHALVGACEACSMERCGSPKYLKAICVINALCLFTMGMIAHSIGHVWALYVHVYGCCCILLISSTPGLLMYWLFLLSRSSLALRCAQVQHLFARPTAYIHPSYPNSVSACSCSMWRAVTLFCTELGSTLHACST
jgi:hypothetical protein